MIAINTKYTSRSEKRYEVRACAFLCWTSSDGEFMTAEGVTRDVSMRGAFVVSDQYPPLGTVVQMNVMLPDVQSGTAGAHLVGEGKVVRVEVYAGEHAEAGSFGFAVSFESGSQMDQAVLERTRTSGSSGQKWPSYEIGK